MSWGSLLVLIDNIDSHVSSNRKLRLTGQHFRGDSRGVFPEGHPPRTARTHHRRPPLPPRAQRTRQRVVLAPRGTLRPRRRKGLPRIGPNCRVSKSEVVEGGAGKQNRSIFEGGQVQGQTRGHEGRVTVGKVFAESESPQDEEDR